MRQLIRARMASQLLVGLMFRDGTSKSKVGQASAAIEYAEELLNQLEARETQELLAQRAVEARS